MSEKIRWLPTLPNDGTRWELEIDGRYAGRIVKTGNYCRYKYRSCDDKLAFSINDAGRKLLAYAKDHLERSSKG